MMKIIIEAEPKELAALVVELQERQIPESVFVPETSDGMCGVGSGATSFSSDNQ